jgi:rubrerythrin
MDEAIHKIKEMGEFTTESVNKGSKALKKDFARAIEELNGTWLSMSGKTAGYFSIWAKRSASFLKQAETAAEHWLKQKGNKINRHTFHSGEITSGGTFACQFCGHIFKQEETDHLPPCPACGETEFKICP